MFIPMWLVVIGGIALGIMTLSIMFMGVLLLGSFLVWLRGVCDKKEDTNCPEYIEKE